MSLGKEDNKALNEINQVRFFWGDFGGGTRSNLPPKGRCEACKSVKPRWFGLSRELPSSPAAPLRMVARKLPPKKGVSEGTKATHRTTAPALARSAPTRLAADPPLPAGKKDYQPYS